MMSRTRRALSKFRALGWRDRLLLAEAVVWLALARVALFVPFRWLAPRLGEATESPIEDHAEGALGARVAWAVAAASRHTPWTTRCLAEAVAAKAMLRLRGVPTTLYLGTGKDERGEFSAHAWLRCGTSYVTGASSKDSYTVIAKFGDRGDR